ncbi:MAG: hypothetical protein GX636_09145 [Actinomycetales bacterium]|nr:hypothetical protein [Actinomycetales bacterium]
MMRMMGGSPSDPRIMSVSQKVNASQGELGPTSPSAYGDIVNLLIAA